MKPNLKSFSINEIDLSGKVELSDDLIQRIRTASPPDEDGDSVFYDYYKVENNTHIGWAVISSPEKGSKTCRFSLHYELGRARKPKKGISSISQALEILSNISGPIELACFSRFEFAKRDKAKTIFNLPLILSESPEFPINEIRGLHLSKVEGKRSVYDVVLDRAKNGTLMENIMFRHSDKINESLVDEVIKHSIQISEGFVIKEK